MPGKKEESAIDVVYKIYDEMLKLRQRLNVIDDNIKIINNKLNKISKNKVSSKPSAVSPGSKKGPRPQPPPQRTAQQEEPKLVLGNIRAWGNISNKAGEGLSNVDINIYDDSNQVVKKVKSSSEGYWEARLPSGRYGIEYVRSGYKPVNKVIYLDGSSNNVEVR